MLLTPPRKVRCLYARYRGHNNGAYFTIVCVHSIAGTPGTHRAPAVPGTGFHLSVPQILLPREAHREGTIRSACSLTPPLSLSLSHAGPLDNAFCERDALYGCGGAAFYRFYIACLTTFGEASRMKNIHLPSERANCLATLASKQASADSATINQLSSLLPFLSCFPLLSLPIPNVAVLRLLGRLEKDSLFLCLSHTVFLYLFFSLRTDDRSAIAY